MNTGTIIQIMGPVVDCEFAEKLPALNTALEVMREEGNVVLRDMIDGKEVEVSLEKLTEDPNSILNLEKP